MISWQILGSNIFAHELLHFLVAALVGSLIYRRYKSLRLVIIVFLVSFLIDLDHLFEVFWLHGFNFWQYIFPFHPDFFRESGKMTLILHNWELLIAIFLFGKKFKKWSLAVTVIAAAASHYLVDNLVYSSLYCLPVLEYSFIFRLFYHFNYWQLRGQCI